MYDTMTRFLNHRDWQNSEGHIARLLERGPRLHPSIAAQCPTRMLFAYREEKLVYELGEPITPEIVHDPETLYLFHMGRVLQDVVTDALFYKYKPWKEVGSDGRVGQEIHLINDWWSAFLDAVTYDGSKVTLWEVKSTKLASIEKYIVPKSRPRPSDVTQLAICWNLWEETRNIPVADAHVVYIPNDTHPKEALVGVQSFAVDRADCLDALDYMRRLELAAEANLEPEPTSVADQYPCSMYDRSAGEVIPLCPFFLRCHPEGLASDDDKEEEIPF